MITTLNKLGIGQKYLNIIKAAYEKPMDDILYVKNNEKFHKKLLELINKLIKITEYEVNTQNQFHFSILTIKKPKRKLRK